MNTGCHQVTQAQQAATGLIRARTEESIRRCTAAGPAAIRERLAQLDQEWDIDRCVAAAASGAILGGLVLGGALSRNWYLLPMLAGGFMLQHAMSGGCLPMDVLRHAGVRTPAEIDEERQALLGRVRQGAAHAAPAERPAGQRAASESGDIPALHPSTRPTPNDYVETAAGRIKPATQG